MRRRRALAPTLRRLSCWATVALLLCCKLHIAAHCKERWRLSAPCSPRGRHCRQLALPLLLRCRAAWRQGRRCLLRLRLSGLCHQLRVLCIHCLARRAARLLLSGGCGKDAAAGDAGNALLGEGGVRQRHVVLQHCRGERQGQVEEGGSWAL